MVLRARLLAMFVVALMLMIVPLPESLIHFRPPLVLLLVFYVQFFLPNQFRVSWVIGLGLCLDVLLSCVMGEHAFALLLSSWVATTRTRQFRFFSTLQQMMILSVFCLIYQSMIYLFDASLGYHTQFMFAIGSSVFGVLCWPWVKCIADYLFFVYSRRSTP